MAKPSRADAQGAPDAKPSLDADAPEQVSDDVSEGEKKIEAKDYREQRDEQQRLRRDGDAAG